MVSRTTPTPTSPITLSSTDINPAPAARGGDDRRHHDLNVGDVTAWAPSRPHPSSATGALNINNLTGHRHRRRHASGQRALGPSKPRHRLSTAWIDALRHLFGQFATSRGCGQRGDIFRATTAGDVFGGHRQRPFTGRAGRPRRSTPAEARTRSPCSLAHGRPSYRSSLAGLIPLAIWPPGVVGISDVSRLTFIPTTLLNSAGGNWLHGGTSDRQTGLTLSAKCAGGHRHRHFSADVWERLRTRRPDNDLAAHFGPGTFLTRPVGSGAQGRGCSWSCQRRPCRLRGRRWHACAKCDRNLRDERDS